MSGPSTGSGQGISSGHIGTSTPKSGAGATPPAGSSGKATALAATGSATKAAGGSEWDAITIGGGKGKRGTAPKADSKKLTAGIGGTEGAPEAGDVAKKGIFDFGRRTAEGPKNNKSDDAVGYAGSALAVAGGVTTAASVAIAGSVASAAMGPFFWVGLIATAVAIAVTLIVGAVSDEQANASEIAAKDAATQEETMAGITASPESSEDFMSEQILAGNDAGSEDASGGKPGGGAAAMMEGSMSAPSAKA